MRCEPDTLALAFQSVQLMCSDYMALLPEELQIGCIQVWLAAPVPNTQAKPPPAVRSL